MTHDVFISHASEDKSAVARPLARALEAAGLSVWLDEAEITIGDSLRGSLDKGLAECRFGVVILSRDFFRKNWPQKELNGLAARESSGAKVILPVWHGLAHDDVLGFSPMLADRVAVSTEHGVDAVAAAVVAAVSRSAASRGVSPEGATAPVDPLDTLRARLLQAPDREALRGLGYEIEALARSDPASHEARRLQDQVHEAIERETIRTQVRPHSPAHASEPAPRSGLARTIVVVLAVVITIVLVAVVWRALQPATGPARLAKAAATNPDTTPAAVSAASEAASSPAPMPMHGLVQLTSDRGDYIGAGKARTFDGTNSRISVSGTRNAVTVEIRGDDTWTLTLAAPEGASLAAGLYEHAQRAAFHNPTRPGLDFSGAGRGCNTLSGQFNIVLIAFDKHDQVDRLVATFEQHCDGKAAALRGSLELVPGAD